MVGLGGPRDPYRVSRFKQIEGSFTVDAVHNIPQRLHLGRVQPLRQQLVFDINRLFSSFCISTDDVFGNHEITWLGDGKIGLSGHDQSEGL